MVKMHEKHKFYSEQVTHDCRTSMEGLRSPPQLWLQNVAVPSCPISITRLFDIVVSLFALIILSPFMLLVAVLIKLETRGPVLYKQERIGFDTAPFCILKFRSMYEYAETSGPCWTIRNDPRRTRIGTVIRRFNIDELPQFYNVLLGHMSIVGPRAERFYFAKHFAESIPGYSGRFRVKPGMTGWAQVNGLRGNTSIEERTKYDLWYIGNKSLFLDIKIFLRQILQLFTSKNAY
jgi:exopolysaccharide biosynthesis polyprenyl glycosylphosphotransferase